METNKLALDQLLDNSLVDALFDENKDILVLATQNFAIARANQAASIFFGAPGDSLIGRSLDAICDAKDQERMKAAASLLCMDGETIKLHLELMDYLGNKRQQAVILRLIRCGRSGIQCYLLSVRRETKASGKGSDPFDPFALKKRLFKGLSDSVIFVDAASQAIIDCNSAAESFFGYSRSELIGRSPLILAKDEEEARGHRARSMGCFAKSGFYQENMQCRRKDGSFFTTLTTSIAFFEDDEAHRYIITINRDLSPLEKRYDDMLRYSEQAESLMLLLKETIKPLKRATPRKSLAELGFSGRQIDIASILVTGETTKAIAKSLNVSEATVKNDLSAIYRIVGASSRMEFLRFIHERQIKVE